jgi:hypothetical protein
MASEEDSVSMPATEITIRPAYADDDVALRRLAALDSAPAVPTAPLLVAELDGVLRVALSLRDGAVIADPFVATSDVIALMRLHAARSLAASRGRRRPTTRWRLGALRPQRAA